MDNGVEGRGNFGGDEGDFHSDCGVERGCELIGSGKLVG
jgi:hypothetical protein